MADHSGTVFAARPNWAEEVRDTLGLNMRLPKTLKENLELGRCIPWCGAGISVACGLPTWSALVDAFIEACTDRGLTEDEQNQLRSLDPEDAIEFCRDYLGENEYRTFLERTLGRKCPPSAIHHKIVSMPIPAVLTTDYDRLIENAVTGRTGTIPPVLTAEDTQMLWRTIAKNEFFVLKVNGDIARPNTVVLTSRDYTRHVWGIRGKVNAIPG